MVVREKTWIVIVIGLYSGYLQFVPVVARINGWCGHVVGEHHIGAVRVGAGLSGVGLDGFVLRTFPLASHKMKFPGLGLSSTPYLLCCRAGNQP